MGFSVTITHLIMVIGAVVLASAFTACAFYTGNVVENEFKQGVSDVKNTVDMQLDIVYATANTSTSDFVIYAKNTGKLPVTDYTYLDVYVGTYGQAQFCSYDQTATSGSGKFKVVDANADGTWDPRETATIYAYPADTVDGSVLEAKIVPSTGIGSGYLFSSPTF
jgi:archaellum component FlaF (FlaF/FlaG flagellin family)